MFRGNSAAAFGVAVLLAVPSVILFAPGASAATALPNLTVPVLARHTQVYPDGSADVSFTAFVQNRGEADAASFTVRVVLDNVTLIEKTFSGLARNATVSFQTPTKHVGTGSHEANAVADVFNRVYESNEWDNTRTERFAFSPPPPPPSKPDLVVLDIALSPPSPFEGDRVTAEATIKNVGLGIAGARDGEPSFFASLQIDSFERDRRGIDALAPGESVRVSFTWTAFRGNHSIAVIADSTRAVDETNEWNNEARKTISVAPRPADLYVSALNVTGTLGEEGYLVTATVTNRLNTAGPSTLKIRVDGGEWLLPIGALAPGKSQTVTQRVLTVHGNPVLHDLTATADARNAVTETDESNNVRSLRFVGVAGAAQPVG